MTVSQSRLTVSHVRCDNVMRQTLHCHMSAVTVSFIIHEKRHNNDTTKTRQCQKSDTKSHARYDNVTHLTWQCHALNFTLSHVRCDNVVWYMTKRHDNDTSKTWQCQKSDKKSHARYDNVIHLTWQCHVLNITMSHVLNNITFNDLWLTACSSKHPSLSFVVYCVCLTGYIVYVSMKMRNWYHWHITMTPCCSHGYR